jgi:ketosteroid isomerase-like protein
MFSFKKINPQIMNTQQIAEKLVSLCREGKNVDAINELYADNIVSVEPKGARFEHTEGKEAVLAKTANWNSMVQEIHSSAVSDAIVMGNFFTVSIDMNITYKEYGRMLMQELAVYEVNDGKVIFEQFFYNIPGQ